MSKNIGEVSSPMALHKNNKKRKWDSPLYVATKRPSTSTLISTRGQDIKVQHQKKKREVGNKRKMSEAAGTNSSLENEDRKKNKMKEMKDQVKEMKASVVDMRTQTDFDRRLVLEAEATTQEFHAILAQLREENKRQLSKTLSDQLLADYLQFIILTLP